MLNILTTQDLMDMFNMSERQIKALYRTENFPVIKIGGKYYTQENRLQDWLASVKNVRLETI